MSQFYKKGVYTLDEISDLIIKKNPGRFKNHDSAYASVKAVARDLNIGDINGKKRNKLIAARDAERILEVLKTTYRKGKTKKVIKAVSKPSKAEQVSLFDDGIIDWLEPYTPTMPKKAYTPPVVDESLTPAEIAAIIQDIIDNLVKQVNALIKAYEEEAN